MTTDLALTDSWAPMLPATKDLAVDIANTEFVPKSLRGKAPAVLACILTGREMGVGPMESLQKIHVVDGKPTLSAELMRSLVLRAGHAIEFRTLTDEKVTIAGRRAGGESWTEVTWTIKDAQRVGVAGKDVWKKYPRQMLSARATSELCRLLFPDALGGVSYTPEEIGDVDDAPVTVTRADKPTTVKRRQPVEKPAPVEAPVTADPEPVDEDITEAEIVDEEPPQDEPEPVKDGATSGQLKMMGLLMRRANITDRDSALLYVSDAIGRPVTSRTELTMGEASKVIESLNADLDAAEAAE